MDEGSSDSSWQVLDGEFQQQESVYTRAALEESYHHGAYAYYQPGTLLTDYHFSVDARMLSSENGEDIGIMFRYQNPENYYRIALSSRNGYMRFEKRVAGAFETLAVNGRGYEKNQLLKFSVDATGPVIHINLNGDAVFSVVDDSLNSGTVALYSGNQAKFDNVLIASPGDEPKITLSTPQAYSVTTGNTLDITAIASNMPPDAEVELVLDGTVSQSAVFVPPSTFTGQFTSVPAGNHTVEAILRDESMVQAANDLNEVVGVSGEYFTVIGDSISNGTGDNYSTDNTSADGRIIAFQGYAANLTDLLNSNRPFANHIVFNEAIGGDESVDAAFSRIDSILSRHPDANKSLVMLGTNDALALIPTGTGCSGAGCNGTFRGNMQYLVDRIAAQSNEVWVASAPPIFGSGGTPFADPLNASVNRNYIQIYNTIINNELTGVQIGPDFFNYFIGSGPNRFSLFSDFLHVNALGHKIMAYLWYNAMNPTATIELPYIVENLALSTEAPFLKQNLLEVGDRYYVDETYHINSIPASLDGGIWIMTANADKNSTAASYVSFTTDRSVSVYVGFDSGASSLPSWLAGFADTGQTIGVTDPLAPVLNLYRQDFSAGSVNLGGNMMGGDNGADSNYVVIVVPNQAPPRI